MEDSDGVQHPSSVSSMSVANVRRALSQMRVAWSEHSPDSPIDITCKLFNGMSIAHFALLFVMGHHTKRSKLDTESPPS